ncbi:MAG: DUF3604 domain-containing protein [Gammaproteobacteria bacterium]|nr:DUF3604 domain-containing protein [Gammaproteobacteria bacterium]
MKQAWLVLGLSALALSSLAEESYSPHVDPSHATNVYWGDTHVHTALSSDAYIFGTRLTPDDAYRFAKGQKIRAASGEEVRLRRPLDFLMVADHAENMGVIARIAAGDEALLTTEAGKRTAEALNYPVSLVEALDADTDDLMNAFNAATLMTIKADQGPAKGLGHADYGIDEHFSRSVWKEVIENAERHNDPGRFTTFSGYEWTVAAGGHRNVIFADGSELTSRVVPFGDPELAVVWTDPDFNRAEFAFYYLRVLEIPTPRWTAYDAKFYGLKDLPDEIPMVTQERAYTSPIWYTPSAN